MKLQLSTKIYLLLYLIVMSAPISAQDDSPYITIINEVRDLRKKTEDKQKQISELEFEVQALMNQKTSDSKRIKKLEKTLAIKTAKILELNGELRSLLSKYNDLNDQIEFLNDQSAKYLEAKKSLEGAIEDLENDLTKSKREIITLRNNLKDSQYKVAALEADNRILEKTVNELLDVKQTTFFIEIAGLNPENSWEVNISNGLLLKGKAFFLGGNVGFAYWEDEDFNSALEDIEIGLIHFTAKAKIPFGNRKLGFQYLDPSENIYERFNFFASMELGYGFAIFSDSNSKFNKGGITGSFGFGIGLSSFEGVNLFLVLGGDVQQLGVKKDNANLVVSENGDSEFLWGFHYGLVFNF